LEMTVPFEERGTGPALVSVKSDTPPRGARQRQRTRGILLAAGEQLFATRSVDGVTVDQIVEAAEVAKGSFYNHFEDKEAFANAVFEIVQGDIEFHVAAANQNITDPATRAMRAFCAVMLYARKHPERLQATLSLAARRATAADPLNAGLVADIVHGLERGQFRDIDIDMAIVVFLGLSRAGIAQAMSPHCAHPPRAISEAVGAALLRGLGMQYDDAGLLARKVAEDMLGDLL